MGCTMENKRSIPPLRYLLHTLKDEVPPEAVTIMIGLGLIIFVFLLASVMSCETLCYYGQIDHLAIENYNYLRSIHRIDCLKIVSTCC